MVIMVMGLPGSGKSYFAFRLAELLHAQYISSDRIRMDKLLNRTYSDREKEFIYDEMLKEMDKAMHDQKDVVLDATFYTNKLREKFKERVYHTGTLAFIEIRASEAVIKNRLIHRREFSEADFEIYNKIKNQWESISEEHLTLESAQGNLHIMLQKAIRYLYTLKNEKQTDQ